MAIPGGGPLTLTKIQTEFGGTAPTQLSEYYKGGAYVPSLSPGNIPTSGAVKFSDYYNGTSILPPPFEIGETVLSESFIGTCTPFVNSPNPSYPSCQNGTAPATAIGTVYDETYTFNPLHDDAEYKVDWSMAVAFPQYLFTYGNVIVYVNGSPVYIGKLGAAPTLPDWPDSWFRDAIDPREVSSPNITLGFGDEVRVIMSVGSRTGLPQVVNHTEFSFNLYRVA